MSSYEERLLKDLSRNSKSEIRNPNSANTKISDLNLFARIPVGEQILITEYPKIKTGLYGACWRHRVNYFMECIDVCIIEI